MISPRARLVRRLVLRRPSLFYPAYARFVAGRARKTGLKRGLVALSFDNDYSADNEAAARLLPLLAGHGIRVTWAVVGRWVEKYEGLHRDLLGAGHELMNHSWSHPDQPELRPGDGRKFDALSPAEVEEEITGPHRLLLDRFGYRVRGFRLPHFRRHPHVTTILQKLGYAYTSNIFALDAPTLGAPWVAESGIVEIPLSALPRAPGRIVETYRLFRGRDGLYPSEEVFFSDFRALVGAAARYGLPVCIYLDAADIERLSRPSFAAYLEVLRDPKVDVVTLGEIAGSVSAR